MHSRPRSATKDVSMKIDIVILAAGRGTRMKSELPKVLTPVAGKPIIHHLIESIKELSAQPILVVGHKAEEVMSAVGERARFVFQREQKGTGHAVAEALSALGGELGSSLLFNINLPINFYSPYKAQNIQDFWRRWHITLSKFLRDYLYIPLGGNQRGELRIYFNLLLTFLLGGLWHGASWTFIFWGAFHGFAMVVHRLWVKANIKMSRMLAWFLTFNFVNMTWIFFRAKSWSDAGKVLRGMLGLNEISFLPTFASGLPFLNRFVAQFKDIEDLKKKMLFLILFGAVIFLAKNSVELQRDFKPNWKNAVFCLLLMAIGIISLTKVSEFIYFNF